MLARGMRILSALRSPHARETVRRTIESYWQLPETECPCCGFFGKFDSYGTRARLGADCPSCHSKERHRLFALAMRDRFLSFEKAHVVHFAPEQVIGSLIKGARPASYRSADIRPGAGDLCLDLEAIDLPSGAIDVLVCSHVLEHVDDKRALSEIARVLRPGGFAVLLVPIIEGWDQTFEDECISTPEARELFFGQNDHVRYYGRDFRDRITSSGLSLREYTANPHDTPRYGLVPGEKIFCASKSTV